MNSKRINLIVELPDEEGVKKLLPFENQEFDFHFNNFNFDVIWDLVLFWGIPKIDYKFRVFNGQIIFMSPEPELMIKYSKSFLNQFKHTITPYNIKKKNHFTYPPYIIWWYGYDFFNKKYNYNFKNLTEMSLPEKTKKMSVITSNKNFMPGHKKRLRFINELKNNFIDEIDFFGSGSLTLNDKSDGLNDYMFHLCFENSISENYWTEKLSDPILGFSIPIYYGCKNIDDFFTKGIIKIDINNSDKAIDQVRSILFEAESLFVKMKKDLLFNRNKIIYEQNLISFIQFFFNENILTSKQKIEVVNIKSFNSFMSNIFLNWILRIKRLFYKLFIN